MSGSPHLSRCSHASDPILIAITPDGRTAYVANIDNFGLGTVTPIAIATNTAQKPITVGAGPTALVIAG